jgi:CTP-dependent riboflavin kinase
MILTGKVCDGLGVAGRNLQKVLHLIEERSGLQRLIPDTMNLRLPAPYLVVPDFVVTPVEYQDGEELRFKHCSLLGIPCLIMRPDSHERGGTHGPASLELMSTVWLRKTFGLVTGSEVSVEVAGGMRRAEE